MTSRQRGSRNTSQVEEGSRLILDEMQRQAVIESVRNGVLVLTGESRNRKDNHHQCHDLLF